MYEKREVTISRVGCELAESPKIKTLVRDIINADEYYPWVTSSIYQSTFGDDNPEITYSTDFFESEGFKQFTTQEQLEAREVTRLISEDQDKTCWTIEKPSDGSKLRVVKAMAHDALLLCGITLEDMERVSPGMINTYTDHGFTRKIDMANFVGACILEKERVKNNFVDFYVNNHDGIRKKIGLGGTDHGDFRIRSSEVYTEGSRDPSGNIVMFAPKVPELYLGTHHSVEPHILVALLKHIDKLGWSDKTQKQYIQRVANEFSLYDDGMRAMGNFGDFGQSNASLQSLIVQEYYVNGVAGYDKPKGQWDALSHPMHPHILQVLTEGDDFVFRYELSSEYKGMKFSEKDGEEIRIPSENLDDFLLALLYTTKLGYGRTSLDALTNILKTRLSVSWNQ